MNRHTKKRKTVVLGASGYMGSNLVPALAEAGWYVRAVARNAQKLEAFGWAENTTAIECLSADALQPETLGPALEGVDVVYYLIHMMWVGGDFVPVEYRTAENVLKACEAAGVRRIVYLGGIMPKQSRSRHMEGRRAVGDGLRSGSVQVVELRAAMVVGPGSAAFEIIRDMVNHLPVLPAPEAINRQSTPLALENALTYLIASADLPFDGNPVHEITGPETLSYKQMIQIYAQAVGKKPRVFSVPFLTPKMVSYVLPLLTTVAPTTAKSLIEGLGHDYIGDGSEMQKRVPQRLLPFREAVAATLATEKSAPKPDRWLDGNIACRGGNPHHAFYARTFCREYKTNASPEALYEVVQQFGKNGDYFSCKPLWWLRRVIDRLVGGASLRPSHHRQDTREKGDIIDGWQVFAKVPNRRLTLRMRMRAPGTGLQEFSIHKKDGQSTLRLCAHWHPAGIWGLLYWYAHYPLYGFIISSALKEAARRAEALDRSTD